LAFDEAIRCDRKFAHASAGGVPDCIRGRAESQSRKATAWALYVLEWLRKMRDTPNARKKGAAASEASVTVQAAIVTIPQRRQAAP
jgi:hypothetical protein